MNKQHDYSDIELRPIKLTNQYIWKENKLDNSTDSYGTSPQPNDNCHNSNIIINNLSEKLIPFTSQRSNIPPVLMICLLNNKFDKNETKGKIIKATKRCRYLVHHKIRLIPIQTKKDTTDVRNDIDDISTTDEDTSLKTKSIDNINEKNKENSEITFGDQKCETTGDSTRILYQNTRSLGLIDSSHPLEEICDFMSTWNVDICCLVETNTHWKHRRTKEKLLNGINKFGKRQKIQILETVTP